MRSSRIVYYLLLAIVGISGCASTDRRYYSAAASSAPAPIARVLPLTAKPTSITTTPQPPTISETPKAVETVELPPMPKPQPAPFVAKSDRADSRDKPATSIARATPSVAPPPPSDNRLIELLEKDIDKAVEQPKERRRLQFSKDVSRASARAPVRQPIFSEQQELFRNVTSTFRQVHADHRESLERRRACRKSWPILPCSRASSRWIRHPKRVPWGSGNSSRARRANTACASTNGSTNGAIR